LGSEGKSSPRFEITTADAQWGTWLAYLRDKHPDKAADAEAAGKLTATGSKWPDKGRLLSIPNATLTPRSRAMAGEDAA
jgi:hypothetical protein